MTTIIGAGFASGQEILQFFSTYYEGGFYGIILAGILFSIIGYIVLDRVYTQRIRNYDEFLFPTLGWFMGWVMEIAVAIFMLCLLCIMVAGSGNIMLEKLGIPFNYGILMMAAICMIVILTGIKGIVAISTVVTPVLITGIIAVGLYVIIYKDTSVFNAMAGFNRLTNNWVFSSLIYVSYNSILSVVIMCSMLPYLKTRRIGIIGGIMGGVLLCFIAFILNSAIFMFYPDVLASELPMLNIIEKYSGILGNIYSFILWLAMFISAVTSGYCFTDRVSSKMRVNRKLLTVVICALAIPLASYGFSGLIAAIYPLFGYIGMFMVFAILIEGLRASPIFIRKR